MKSSVNDMEALDFLKKLISIPSISTEKDKSPFMQEALTLLAKELKKLDFDVQIIKTKTQPLLYAARIKGHAETIGIYTHYDVQPPEPLEEWQSPPFTLTERKGKLYGRGTADDKGHLTQALHALKQLIKSNTLNKNIVFLCEGEEEIGSFNFEWAVQQIEADLKKVDVFYILDSGMKDKKTPAILYGLRGLTYYELEVISAKSDLHSGLMGNSAPNAAVILTQFLSTVQDKDSTITLPHFYDTVRPIDTKELALLKQQARGAREEQRIAGVQGFMKPKGLPYYVSTKIFPSFDVHGVASGFIGEGSKTIIPSRARAKFSFRLVPDQKPAEIDTLLKKHIKKFFASLPVQYKLTEYGKAKPFIMARDNPYIQTTAAVLRRHFNHETVFNRSGGSIPAAEILSRLFQKPIIITGFTLPDSNLHAPNENIDRSLFEKGIDTLTELFSNTL